VSPNPFNRKGGVFNVFQTIRQKRIPLLRVAITDLYRLKILFDHFGVDEKHSRKFSAGQIIIYFLTKSNAGTVIRNVMRFLTEQIIHTQKCPDCL
jgi:hypothetical protein